MPEIQGGRWAELARRLFDLKGNTSAVMGLGWEVQPTQPVEDIQGFELRWPRDVFSYAAWQDVAAVAGERGYIELTNTTTAAQPHIGILDWITMTGEWAAVEFQLKIDFTGPTATNNMTAIPTDTRLAVNRTIAAANTEPLNPLYDTAVGPPGTTIWSVRQGTSHGIMYKLPILLYPGHSIILASDAVNTQVQLGIGWHHRRANPAELPPV